MLPQLFNIIQSLNNLLLQLSLD